MPVWYEKLKPFVEEGALDIVGIVQEQHPDRAVLYAQWRGFDFPILWDPFGATGLEVVPVLTGIDEHGVVRVARPGLDRFVDEFVAAFLQESFEAPEGEEPVPGFELTRAMASEREEPVGSADRAIARLLLGRSGAPTIGADVAALEALADVGRPVDRFRAGVARRLRYDGPAASAEDFQRAVDHWRSALLARPDQYIWRRRIQQWGPRLDKPYAFYDWVESARAEVEARGEVPVEVLVPLSGSEVAGASQAIPIGEEDDREPDPTGGVARDAGAHAQLETAVARHTAAAGPRIRVPSGSARVHVTLRPRGPSKWAVDADPAQLWLELPDGWTAERRLIEFPAPREGREQRPLRVDFGVSSPLVDLGPPDPDAPPPPSEATLGGYVVYSICLEDGTCVFRRQDVEIVVPLMDRAGDGDQGDPAGDRKGKGDD
ncbi:MAG: hypothetical protein AAF726_15820 [Planctomycetota bacterium]